MCASEEVRLLSPGTEDEVEFGAIGALSFRGSTTLTGYLGDEEANATNFTSDGFVAEMLSRDMIR